MTWTEERIEHLKSLYRENLSASRIATAMGGGLTRNAVIGKLNRLGFVQKRIRFTKPCAPRPSVAKERASRAPSGRRRSRQPSHIVLNPSSQKLPAEPVMKPNCIPVTIEQLDDRACRFPIGEVASKDFGYCGSPEAQFPKNPYCPYHAQIAFTAPSERQNRSRVESVKRPIPTKVNF